MQQFLCFVCQTKKYLLMKLFLTPLFVLLMISCTPEKEVPDTALTGTWHLTKMVRKSTGEVVLPPAGAFKNVSLTFLANGQFYGNTLYNLFSEGRYRTNENNNLIFVSFASTKVMEDEWGIQFTSVLRSCDLQSIAPCKQPTYSISGKTMTIQSVMDVDLIMTKQ